MGDDMWKENFIFKHVPPAHQCVKQFNMQFYALKCQQVQNLYATPPMVQGYLKFAQM